MAMLRISAACLAFLPCMHAGSLTTLEGLTVSMPGTNDKTDGVQTFGIEVTQGKSWTVHHRYTDFAVLRNKLGDEAQSFADAPFPGKFWWPYPSQQALDGRRKELEAWLKKCLLHTNSSWKEPLLEFIQEDAVVGETAKDSLFKGLHSINIATYDGFEATKKQLNEWYVDGKARCAENEKCKFSMEKFDSATKAVEGFSASIGTKMGELQTRVTEALALEKAYTTFKEKLEQLRSGGASAEEVKEAEGELKEAEGKAVEAAKHVEELKADVDELQASAQTTMEASLQDAMQNAEKAEL